MNVGYIGAIIVLIVMIVFVVYRKFFGSENGKEEAKKFLISIEEDFEEIIISYLQVIDISNFDNLIEVEKEIIDSLVDTLWEKALQELDHQVTDKLTKAIIKKYLTREFVQSFIQEVFEKSKVQKIYTSKYNDAILAANSKAEKLEEETVVFNQEIEDDDPVGFREVDDIATNSIIDEDGKIIEQEIIPQIDDKDDFIEDDGSIEILD